MRVECIPLKNFKNKQRLPCSSSPYSAIIVRAFRKLSETIGAKFDFSQDSFNFSDIYSADKVAITYGPSGSAHTVGLNKITMRLRFKLNGKTTMNYRYQVMDPAGGGRYRNLTSSILKKSDIAMFWK